MPIRHYSTQAPHPHTTRVPLAFVLWYSNCRHKTLPLALPARLLQDNIKRTGPVVLQEALPATLRAVWACSPVLKLLVCVDLKKVSGLPSCFGPTLISSAEKYIPMNSTRYATLCELLVKALQLEDLFARCS